MHVESLFYLRDLESKPTLTTYHVDTVDFFSCSHLYMDTKLKPSPLKNQQAQTDNGFLDHDSKASPSSAPITKSQQSEICRFTQEAIATQFLLSKKLNRRLDSQRLHKIFSRVQEVLDFFLLKHQWQAYLHICILLNGSKFGLSKTDETFVITIGHPLIMTVDLNSKQLLFFEDGEFKEVSEPKLQTSIGSLGNHREFEIKISKLKTKGLRPLRVIVGAHGLQELSAQRLQPIFVEDWHQVENAITKVISSNESIDLPPFTCFQVTSQTRWSSPLNLIKNMFHS